MPNISKKTAYDIKEASNPSLSKSARWHYQENAQAAAKADGAAMCGPHMESAKQERKNLMKDMPVDNRAGVAMKGTFMSKHCNCR